LRYAAWLDGELEQAIARVAAMEGGGEDAAKRIRGGVELAQALLREEVEHRDPGGPGNVHWANFMDRTDFERHVKPFFENWLEAADHPDGWRTVRNARGVFRGEAFEATNGIAVLAAPAWVSRGGGEKGYHRLLRLSPAQVETEDGRTLVGFEAIDPWVMDSGYNAGKGVFRLEDGLLVEQRAETDD
jgi:hypothetical protein